MKVEAASIGGVCRGRLLPRGAARGAVTRFLALVFLLLGTGCATTQMSPNRRLALGEGVFTVTGEANPVGWLSRGGVLLSAGLGMGDLEASAAVTWFGSVHLSGGARLYLGPVNVTGRVGVVREWATMSTPQWLPAWDARVTTVSHEAWPYYFGVHTAGLVERIGRGSAVDRVPRWRAGLLAGYEVWNTRFPVQVEVTFNLLELQQGELGFLREEGASGIPLFPFLQVLHVGAAFHFPFGPPTGRQDSRAGWSASSQSSCAATLSASR